MAHHNVTTAAMKSKQSVELATADALEHKPRFYILPFSFPFFFCTRNASDFGTAPIGCFRSQKVTMSERIRNQYQFNLIIVYNLNIFSHFNLMKYYLCISPPVYR